MLNHITKQFFTKTPLIPKLISFNEVKTFHIRKLTPSQAQEVVAKVLTKDWHLEENGLKLKRDIKFNNFKEAFSFMNCVAILAEKIDHHPDWHNVFNQVNIHLTTHDCEGISMKDIILAFSINELQKHIIEPSSLTDTSFLNEMDLLIKWNDLIV